MDVVNPAQFIFASFLVLGLLGLLAVVLKYYSSKGFVSKSSGRVAVVETHYIDHKNRILLVKRDDVEHLLLISEGKATIIESGIKHGG
jgi:hypothetical protein